MRNGSERYSYVANSRSPAFSHFIQPLRKLPQSTAFARGELFDHSFMLPPKSP